MADIIVSKLCRQQTLFGSPTPELDRTLVPRAEGAALAAAIAESLLPQKPEVRPFPKIGHLLLVDGRAVLDSCWHASNGHLADTVGSFCAVVNLAIERQSPTHIGVAFDHPEGSQPRKSRYPGYKANRVEKQLDHLAAIDLGMAAARGFGWTVIYTPSGEADDVLATCSKRVEESTPVTILSQDKDLLALCVHDDIGLLWRRKGEWHEWRGQQAAQQRLGVDSHQVADLLALVGDASDNVTGATGIGEKTAAALLARYGSLDGIAGAMARGVLDIKGAPRVATLLQQGWAAVKLARWAVALCTDLEDEQIPQSVWEVDERFRWSSESVKLDQLDRLGSRHSIKYLTNIVSFQRLLERDRNAPPRF